MRHLRTAAAVGVAMLGAACAQQQSLYAWNDYDDVLYRHYQAPADKGAYRASLGRIVSNAEAEGRVPPGLYAEYGYALLAAGDDQAAVAYFEKEQARWPESRAFMQRLIGSVNGAGTAETTPAADDPIS